MDIADQAILAAEVAMADWNRKLQESVNRARLLQHVITNSGPWGPGEPFKQLSVSMQIDPESTILDIRGTPCDRAQGRSLRIQFFAENFEVDVQGEFLPSSSRKFRVHKGSDFGVTLNPVLRDFWRNHPAPELPDIE